MRKGSSRKARPAASPPTTHDYAYSWVRLRSASSHPFIYRRMVDQADPKACSGDIVAVYDRRGEFFGHAFYHSRSQIALRMLSYDPAPIDEGFFRERIGRAARLREQILGPQGDTDTYRLVHAEGDALSGLVAERYADWIVIEIFSLGIFNRLGLLKQLLSEATGLGRFVVRADEHIERVEGFRVEPEMSDPAPPTVTVFKPRRTVSGRANDSCTGVSRPAVSARRTISTSSPAGQTGARYAVSVSATVP